jgi:hypothetical protein
VVFVVLVVLVVLVDKNAAIVNPENKIKVNWTVSWPSALEISGEPVL